MLFRKKINKFANVHSIHYVTLNKIIKVQKAGQNSETTNRINSI